ncbi:MAG: hypothetical protein JO219_00235 [Candidatus Eremiobacteraeota bacterium]|nr:hypothetical protein [Candidatus Eremiobacteraeota bacterium]
MLHPEGNLDPNESLHVYADADGVVRFLAVRPTLPNSVQRLMLDCSDSNQRARTYAIDLGSEATFKPRPFDGARAHLAIRPALTGDPNRLTADELLAAGYGLRPDPAKDPDGYQEWLAAARVPTYKLRSDPTLAGFPITRLADIGPTEDPAESITKKPSVGWTGVVLYGSFQKKSTAAETVSYGASTATVVVPKLTKGPTAAATIWNGLDNVFQALIDVNTTPTIAYFGIHHQSFDKHFGHTDTAGTRFTPRTGDHISMEEWYCDAKGHANLNGGYECTNMVDSTQHAQWECDKATSSDCPSYKLYAADLGNGKLGWQTEFIIEDDSKHAGEWPIFSPVTMHGSADVIVGNGTKGFGRFVSVNYGSLSDPKLILYTDNNHSTTHLHITLPSGAVKWVQITCSSKDTWSASSGNCVPK